MTPRISVVMTSFNRSEHIRRAIRSVIDQTFAEWELIIVDDASDEATRAVIRDCARQDDRIRLVFRTTNFGTHTRPKNEGTHAAQADDVAYLGTC